MNAGWLPAMDAWMNRCFKAEADRDKLAMAIIEILKANDDFRAGMPQGWEGDPLQDACEAARKLVASVVGGRKET